MMTIDDRRAGLMIVKMKMTKKNEKQKFAMQNFGRVPLGGI